MSDPSWTEHDLRVLKEVLERAIKMGPHAIAFKKAALLYARALGQSAEEAAANARANLKRIYEERRT